MRRMGMFGLSIGLLVASLAAWYPFGIMAMPHKQSPVKSGKTRTQNEHAALQTDEVKQLREQVEAARAKAADAGSYACCIQPPCSWCLLHLGKCTCVLGVGSGKWACRECHGGWEADQGRLLGVTKEDVRKMKTLGKDVSVESVESAGHEPGGEKNSTSAPEAKTPQANAQLVQNGQTLFESNRCRSCHTLNGKGGAIGPDLTHEAQRHADIAWQIEHLKNPSKVSPGSTMPSYAKLKPEELKALASYLVTNR